MKPYLSATLIRVLTALVVVSVLLTAVACSSSLGGSDSALTDGGEAVTLPPVTIPDLTDDRVPTDTAVYAERLEALFATAVPASESDFICENNEDGVTLLGYEGGETVLVIPTTVGGRPVTAIADSAFKNMTSLKAVSIPDTVTSVGKSAFEGCKNLTSMRTPVYTCEDAPYFGALFGATTHEANGGFVPVSLSTLVLTKGTIIPDYAFYACRGLEVVALPEATVEIGDFSFYGCEGLAYITTADTALTTLGEHAFAGCVRLLNMTLPDTVAYMGEGMLEGCGKLESLTIPFVGGSADDSSAESAYLGYVFGASHYTFTAGYIPASLITVTVSEGCTAIPANAFFECASIREIHIPEGVTTVGRRAFYGCEGLNAMTLPDSVVSVGDDAFYGCIRMQTFVGGAGLTELGVQSFMGCLSLITVTLPKTVTTLPNSCFSGCLSLTTLIAEGVTAVGNKTFHQCGKLTGWGK